MKKILVPIDFSACSRNSLKNAIIVAEKLRMELLLYHSVVVPVAFADGAPITAVDMGFEEMEAHAESSMKKLKEEFPDLKRVTHSDVLQYGSLQESISELVDKENIGLILMGTHGASGFEAALLGSNTYHVMKHVQCPVIALPENADITKMSHIALAGDYKSVPDHDTLQFVMEFARAFYAQIHIIHIDKGEVVVKDQIDIARSMERYLKNTEHTFHFRKFEDVEEGLVAFAKEKEIDLLVMIAKHHGFFERLRHGSSTKKMLMDIPMPLMVLQEQK